MQNCRQRSIRKCNTREDGKTQKELTYSLHKRQAADITAGNQYHATEQLMKMYRTIAWSIRGRATLLINPGQPACTKPLDELLYYLSEFAPIYLRKEFESKINEIFFTKWMLELVDTAVMKVREYPGKGRAYYDILCFTYMDEVKHTEWDILAYISIERSNYYRKRKEALTILSQVLWGMAIPAVKKLIDVQQTSDKTYEYINERRE